MSKLEYKKIAKRWSEALPLGNGKTAVMVYGSMKKIRFSFNDSTLWSGYPKNGDNPNSAKVLEKVREMIYSQEYYAAQDIVQKNMCGSYSEAYMPLGDLVVNIKTKSNSDSIVRKLDLKKAISTTTGKGISQESFVSFPDYAFFCKLSFENKSQLTLSASTKLKGKTDIQGQTILLNGFAPDVAIPNYVISETRPIRYDDNKAMGFCMGVKIVDTDGQLQVVDKKVVVKNATYAIISAVTQTGFEGYNKMPSRNIDKIIQDCVRKLDSVKGSYEQIKQRHIKDFENIICKHELLLDDLNCDYSVDVIDALKKAKTGNVSPSLINVMYDLGKYLIVSGSRDSQPLNLQGQWNKSVRPPWSSNLTTNINYQMNYWGASQANLDECIQPFYKAAHEIAANGANTAKTNFGANGFACNHNVDIWRKTSSVIGDAQYMYAPLCGAWIANEYFAHKQNANIIDKDTVELISASAEFCLDYLTEHNGQLVTCPSASPETKFFFEGKRCALGYASAFDLAIIKQCFVNCLKSDIDKQLKDRINQAMTNIKDFTLGSTGINEWHEDYPIEEKGHRHFSPLYGMYPAKIIGYYSTPEQCQWAAQLFYYRMANAHNSIGWSAAWAMCISAVLHDKHMFDKLNVGFFKHSVFKNLFAFHPPTYFQIDGNLGYVASINSALVYEDNGILDLLPAVPDNLKNGQVRGMLINGTIIDFNWKNGKVTSISSDKPIKISSINLASDVVCNNVSIVSRNN